jgi:DNA-binding IclR family transcriptional regulator
MSKTDYTSDSQQRVLKTLLVLFGHEIDGLAPGQVAKLVGTSASNATRDLANLIEAGIAEQTPHNGNYRLTPMLGRKAMAILTTIERAASRVEETRQRYTRTS